MPIKSKQMVTKRPRAKGQEIIFSKYFQKYLRNCSSLPPAMKLYLRNNNGHGQRMQERRSHLGRPQPLSGRSASVSHISMTRQAIYSISASMALISFDLVFALTLVTGRSWFAPTQVQKRFYAGTTN